MMTWKTFVASQIRKFPRLVRILEKVAHKVSPETVAVLEYPLILKRRWDEDHPHQQLYGILDQHREQYRTILRSFLPLTRHLTAIPVRPAPGTPSSDPCWINGAMPALDGVALYSFIAAYRPKIYLEVGSGNSTKFARKAIRDHNLNTRIISIDPCPRAEVDAICDEIIRQPVEEIDLRVFDRLDADDILYIDNSHRAFMNSDVTTMFLDVVPRLRKGVLVQVHDVTLPYDYPAKWTTKYYSEQYLLAAFLLAGNPFEIILPNMFVSRDKELNSILAPLWQMPVLKDVETFGCSCWLRIR